jgi:hypothetical protein
MTNFDNQMTNLQYQKDHYVFRAIKNIVWRNSPVFFPFWQAHGRQYWIQQEEMAQPLLPSS